MTEVTVQPAVEQESMQSFLDRAYNSRSTDGDLKVYALTNPRGDYWRSVFAHRVILARFPKLKDNKGSSGNLAELKLKCHLASLRVLLKWIYGQPLASSPQNSLPIFRSFLAVVDTCLELQNLAIEYEIAGLQKDLESFMIVELQRFSDAADLIKAVHKLVQSKAWTDVQNQILVKARVILEKRGNENEDEEKSSVKRPRTDKC